MCGAIHVGRRAHPRWRGEDPGAPGSQLLSPGSSPLARGGQKDHPDLAGDYGLIPAGAGRTHGQDQGTGAGAAHPRWRGEDHGSVGETMTISGSSPLARGGRSRILGVSLPDGLIPAGAGRTVPVHDGRGAGRAHPRWRGEDMSELSKQLTAEGSSPLARGGRAISASRRRRRGLIPAGAGRTGDRGPCAGVGGAHPRWRGEDFTSSLRRDNCAGSSPLARGGPH